MRNRAFRRHQTYRHMWRRLKEDRNQHYNDLSCPCWSDKKAMAKFKEQPKQCSCWMCSRLREFDGPTWQEVRFQSYADHDWKNSEAFTAKLSGKWDELLN